jgi:hypothetical protein
MREENVEAGEKFFSRGEVQVQTKTHVMDLSDPRAKN